MPHGRMVLQRKEEPNPDFINCFSDLVGGQFQIDPQGCQDIGAAAHADSARRRMGEIHDVLLTTGCTPEQARDFIAQGMLINVMLSIGAPEHLDESPAMAMPAECALGPLMEVVAPGA